MFTHDRHSLDESRQGYLIYQGQVGGTYPPVRAVPVIRGKSRMAIKQELGRQTGTGRRGFPHLPVEGAPVEGDTWRG